MADGREFLKRTPLTLWKNLLPGLFLFFACAFIECRNIRGHGRIQPRADPHIVTSSKTSREIKTVKTGQQGRRCQVTTIERSLKLFELPYYNEGKTVLPYFVKISGKMEWKKGKHKYQQYLSK